MRCANPALPVDGEVRCRRRGAGVAEPARHLRLPDAAASRPFRVIDACTMLPRSSRRGLPAASTSGSSREGENWVCLVRHWTGNAPARRRRCPSTGRRRELGVPRLLGEIGDVSRHRSADSARRSRAFVDRVRRRIERLLSEIVDGRAIGGTDGEAGQRRLVDDGGVLVAVVEQQVERPSRRSGGAGRCSPSEAARQCRSGRRSGSTEPAEAASPS
jgi:hypothetical protein